MSSAPKTRQFLLDRCRTKYSWAAGVTRGTPSAIQWHRKDLDTAFAEIDGLMAGLRYQDKVERCRSQAAASPLPQNPLGAADEHGDLLGTRQYPTQLLDEHLPDLSAATIENHTAAAAAYVPASPAEPIPGAEHQPMATQWAALRNLRDETAFHHKRFEQLCRDLGDPTISKLLEIYPDAQSIRNQGAQLVKDVLEGFRPRELSLVFAFVSFAYAISQLLYKKGRIDQREILADLKVWRSLILDSRERQAFDLIAQRLWPEAKDHLHFIPVVAQHRVAQFPHLSSGDVGLTESAITDFLSSPADGQDATDQHIGLFGTDQFGFGNAASHNGQQDVINPEVEVAWAGSLMKKSNGEFAFDRLQLAAASSPNNEFFHQAPSCFGWTQPDSTDHPGSPSPRGGTPDVFGGGREQPQPTKPGPVSKEVELEDSGIFLVVLVFLLDIADLVYTLSGRSLASRRHKLYKAEERDQEGFYKFARETFFKPHRQELQTPAFSALLYVAEKFTKGGLLRSIAEIKHYLVSVATVSQALRPNNRHMCTRLS